jgi:predicted nucleotidyltransferase
MNNDTQQFIEELKARSDVLGVIMFGSWARGNNRPDSDVDLVVILRLMILSRGKVRIKK